MSLVDEQMTFKRFGLGVGALFIVMLVVVAVMVAIWPMQFGLSRMFTFTLVDNVEKTRADQIADMRIDGPD